MNWRTAVLLVMGAALAGAQAPEPSQGPPAQSQEPPGVGTPEYAGPAILSRGAGSVFRTPSRAIRFRPFLNLTGSFDHGLLGVSIRPDGSLASANSYGAEVMAGVTGYHPGRTYSVALSYSGSYNHYTQAQYYNGTQQNLTLSFTKRVSRRWSLNLSELAAITNRPTFLGAYTAYGTVSPDFVEVPRNDVFDNTLRFISSLASATYQQSARLSFNFGGDAFFIRRRSSALFGYDGYRAFGDVMYRVTRRFTTGVNYSFTHFKFTRQFGATDYHTVQLVESVALGPRLEASLAIGASRVETLVTGTVAVAPEIAAITGRSVGYEAIYRINYVPNWSANLSKGFRTSSISAGYSSGVSPGNGLYTTSRSTAVNAGYNYSGFRKWSVSASAAYSRYGSMAQQLGRYESYTVGAGANRTIWRFVALTTRADYMKYQVGNSLLDRNTYRAAIGLSFYPNEFPLSIW